MIQILVNFYGNTGEVLTSVVVETVVLVFKYSKQILQTAAFATLQVQRYPVGKVVMALGGEKVYKALLTTVCVVSIFLLEMVYLPITTEMYTYLLWAVVSGHLTLTQEKLQNQTGQQLPVMYRWHKYFHVVHNQVQNTIVIGTQIVVILYVIMVHIQTGFVICLVIVMM